MRGRKPTPTPLKILAGNPGKRRLNKAEPRPSRDLPLCPEWLPDEAKAEWNGIVPELSRLGLLCSVDKAALAGYCHAYAKLAEAVRTLKANGRTVTNGQGTLVAHPAVADENQAMTAMLKFLSEFGLSPVSRTRLKSEADGPVDEFAAFMGAASA